MSGTAFAVAAYVVGLGLFAAYSVRLWWMLRGARTGRSSASRQGGGQAASGTSGR